MDWNATVTQYDVPGMAYHLATAKDTSEYCTDTASQADCALGGSTIVNAMILFKRSPGTTLASQDGNRYDDAAFDIVSGCLFNNGWSKVNALKRPEEKQLVFAHPT
ncbi:hypothetical protein ACHAQF_005952 [Verticillium nonalfalfae]